MAVDVGSISRPLFYVLILYAPTVILHLPWASSYCNFMNRRFICAATWSWQGVVYPLQLTSFFYAGSLVLILLLLLESWKENGGGCSSFNDIKSFVQSTPAWILTGVSNISVWRNFIVVFSLATQSFLVHMHRFYS